MTARLPRRTWKGERLCLTGGSSSTGRAACGGSPSSHTSALWVSGTERRLARRPVSTRPLPFPLTLTPPFSRPALAALLPAAGQPFAPKPLQHLMEPDSVVGELYELCAECDRLRVSVRISCKLFVASKV